jgi:hypothetical protein
MAWCSAATPEGESIPSLAAGRVGLEGSGALAWRLALRVGIMLLQQKLRVVGLRT